MSKPSQEASGKERRRRARGWARWIPTGLVIILGLLATGLGFSLLAIRANDAEQRELDMRATQALSMFEASFARIETVISSGSVLATSLDHRGPNARMALQNALTSELGALLAGVVVVEATTLEGSVEAGSITLFDSLTAAERRTLRRAITTGKTVLVRSENRPNHQVVAVGGSAAPGGAHGIYVELAIPKGLQQLTSREVGYVLYSPPIERPENLRYSSGPADVASTGARTVRELELGQISVLAVFTARGRLTDRWTSSIPWVALLVGLLGTLAAAALVEAMRSARDNAYRLVAELELKHAELDRIERRYREFVERLPLVTYTDHASPNAPTIYVSPQIETLLGFPAEDFVRSPELWTSLLHPDDAARVLEETATHVRTGEPFASEYRLVAADGSERWVHDASVIVDVDDAKVISGYWQDVTERKELEHQLQASQRMEAIGRLAGGIAHDFNNILSIILASTEFLLERMDPADGGRPDVEEIRRAADRAAGLTRQLVAFSRRQVLRPEHVDVNEIVGSMELMLSRLFGAEVGVITKLCDRPCMVEVDPGQLEQVIVNLAVNARDAMPAGGNLSLLTDVEQLDDGTEVVTLVVRDTGLGMDRETLGRVFEPFFTTKESGRGTGLGLATVYGIVKQSRGTITVESEPGSGTTFRIELPSIRAASNPERSGAPVAEIGTPKLRVLLVEDNDDVRRATRRMLERFGHTVTEAASGRKALELVGAPGLIDLLVTDVVMPLMGGVQLVDQLRVDNPLLPVVYMSGFPGTETGGIVETDARTMFVAKPFGAAQLAAAIERVAGAGDRSL